MQKTMYAFVKKQRLDKPSKNDIFFDAGRMSRDEFRELMMADRK
ncbi:hypothetical protein [Lachnoclostridium sp.]|nr:hypothetical protein [Lachnoclostridium sp.]